MIFITVGTENFPFNRLLKAIDEAKASNQIKEEVFAQRGNSDYLPSNYDFANFLDFYKELEYIKKADIVITHAGTGSTFLTLSFGKIPIIFPRQKIYNEHLDDHQIEFTKKMQQQGKVLAAYNEKELIKVIKNYTELLAELQPFSAGGDGEKILQYLRKICSE